MRRKDIKFKRDFENFHYILLVKFPKLMHMNNKVSRFSSLQFLFSSQLCDLKLAMAKPFVLTENRKEQMFVWAFSPTSQLLLAGELHKVRQKFLARTHIYTHKHLHMHSSWITIYNCLVKSSKRSSTALRPSSSSSSLSNLQIMVMNS